MARYQSGRKAQSRPRGALTAACAAFATVAAAAVLTPAPAATASAAARLAGPGLAGSGLAGSAYRISPIALGLNTAPWDYLYSADTSAGGGVNVIEPWLRAAGIDLLKYGGGSYADYYDWQTNSNIQNCLPYDTTASFVVTSTGCATSDVLGFDQFSAQAREIGAGSFATVNYGSGTPSQAAAWIARSRTAPSYRVARWEVGNETYGCWEVNNWLAKPPEKYKGYTPGTYTTVHGVYENPTCPQARQGARAGTQTLATSYAAHALTFLVAMTKADPQSKLGVPWAFGSNVRGASVPIDSEWNGTVLREDGKYISFVDAHYYPFDFRGSTGGANPTDQQVLQSLRAVPSLYAGIRAQLRRYASRAQVVVGETGVSPSVTTLVCTPAGALFAAGDVLSWLAAGAESVDWWDMNGGGNDGTSCVNPDVGMFTSGSPPAPETPYYGYLLASALARPRALLSVLPTSRSAYVLAYQSELPGGGEAVAFINTNTRWSQRLAFRPEVRLRGKLTTLSYTAAHQNRTDSKIVTGSAWASSFSGGIDLPAESMVILESS
jgi:hypothetical protein